MSFLPNAQNVHIDSPKLTYLLINPKKAGFFIHHGFEPSRPQELDAALRAHPIQNQIENTFHTVHGEKYTVRCTMPSPDRRNPCTFTVWIVDPGQGIARFVTGYASPLP